MDMQSILLKTLISCLFLYFPKTSGTLKNIYEVPRFLKLPPPVVYCRGNSSLKIKCFPWPEDATVNYLLERINTRDNRPYMYNLPPTMIVTNQSELIISKLSFDNDLKGAYVRCSARTIMGTVLSDYPIHIVESKIADFYGETDLTNKKHSKVEFLSGNVGIIDCYPPESQPEAEVTFTVNKTQIRPGGKYKIIRWPDGKRVSLLIHSLEKKDNGYYSCQALNPVSLRLVHSNKIYYLSVIKLTTSKPAIIRVPVGGSDKPKTITVKEGSNLTLLCVLEGAPVPRVYIYKSKESAQDPRRFIPDSNFGTLTMINMIEEDSGTYACSSDGHQLSEVSTVEVRVEKRLKITLPPKDIFQKGTLEATFFCNSSDPKIQPLWYLNGKSINLARPSTASHSIKNVRREHLGVYQCVLHRDNEWVSESATLLDSNTIRMPMQKDSQAYRSAKKYSVGSRVNISCEEGSALSESGAFYVWFRVKESKPLAIPFIPVILPSKSFPRVEVRNNHLVIVNAESNDSALYICEKLLNGRVKLRKDITINIGKTTLPLITNENYGAIAARVARGILKPAIQKSDPNFHIKAQSIYDNLAVLLTWNYTGKNNFTSYRIQYVSRPNTSSNWGDVQTTHDIKDPNLSRFFFYKDLKPGMMYKFRVHGVMEYSSVFTNFSNTVSFLHIKNSQPFIDKINETHNGLFLEWTYSGNFAVDNFLILVRCAYASDSTKNSPGKYRVYNVTNPDSRFFFISGLQPDTLYNIVVYGVKNPTSTTPRMITRFSGMVHRKTLQNPYQTSATIWDSNKLLFYILGGVLLIMFVIMVFLLCLCFCRQCRKNKKETAYQFGYKDPAKMIHREKAKTTNAYSSFMLARLPNQSAVSNGHATAVGGDPPYNETPSHYGSKAYLDGSAVGGSLMEDHYAQQRMLREQLSPQVNDTSFCLKRESPSGGSIQDTMKEGYPVRDGYRGQPDANYFQYSSNSHLSSQSNIPQQQQYHIYQPHNNTGLPSYSSALMMNGEGAIPPQHSHGNMMMPSVTYFNSGQANSHSGYAPLPMLHHTLLPQGRRPSQQDVSGDGLSPRNIDSESVYSFRSQQEFPHAGAPFMTSSDQANYSNTISGDSQMKSHHRRRRRPKGNVDPNVLPEGMVTHHDYQNSNDSLPQPFAYNNHLHQQMSNNSDMSNPRDQAIAPVGLPASLSHRSLQMIGAVNGSQYSASQPPLYFESNSTLTRRGTPTLFNEPPKVRDYSEYGIPLVANGNNSPVAAAYAHQQTPNRMSNAHHHSNSRLNTPPHSAAYREAQA